MSALDATNQLSMDLDTIIKQSKAAKRSARSAGANKKRPAAAATKKPARKSASDGLVSASAAKKKALADSLKKEVGSTKIAVTNLDKGVTENDLKELFKRIGKVRSVQLFFSKDGKSQGIAHVQYHSHKDAQQAIAQYNNVTLDGKPMHIEFVISADSIEKQIATVSQVAKPAAANGTSSKAKPAPPAAGSRKRAGKRSGRGGAASRKSDTNAPAGANKRRGGRARAPAPTAMELDQDLDAYMATRNAAGDGAADAMQTD